MIKKLLLLTTFSMSLATLFSQEYRTFDGTGNNIENPEWGAAHTQLQRIVPNDYADGYNAPGGINRPNPRTISNVIFQQDSLIMDALALSDYVWVWGQFIDHDLTAVKDSPNEPVMIPVPQGDPWLDPFNTGSQMIPMMRSATMEGSGTNVSNPREHVNTITSFLDASSVYGSDEERADWLRTGIDGKLLTSADNLLPFNTNGGQLTSGIDLNAPEMDDPVGVSSKHFVAGDTRANENPLLAGFHTLFIREHNRLCDELKATHPSWDDEMLYQHARRIVGGLIQSVTYEQWLPAMGVHFDEYSGYDPSINPSISNLFSGAAFRLGHTLISSSISRLDYDGNTIAEGNLSLKDGFFNPFVILETENLLDPYFKGMGVQIQQDFDARVVSDVRNFLFGPPGAGGLDLAAININRGRERGIPAINVIRTSFGLQPFNNFLELTGNQLFADKLASLYDSVDDVDAWVGLLAESKMPNALFGETIMTIMMQQFGDLRDGDRFFYLNDPDLTQAEKYEIQHTTLADIIERNTNITVMQDNVFVAMPHEMLCQAVAQNVNIGGQLNNPNGLGIQGIEVELERLNSTATFLQFVDNDFDFANVETCNGYRITPTKDTGFDNGVTTLDMVLVRKHILQTTPFTDPLKLLAADANGSGSVSTLDLVAIRKVILDPTQPFTNSPSWKFIPADFVFDIPTNPWINPINNFIEIHSLEDVATANFIGYKVGDVNFNANVNNLLATDDRNDDALIFHVNNQKLRTEETIAVDFFATDISAMEGYQFTLNFDKNALEYVGFDQGALADMTADNFLAMPEAGAITTNWVGNAAETDKALFTLYFKAKTSREELKDVLQINSRYTLAEAVNTNLETLDVELEFNTDAGNLAQNDLVLYQNQPNPFTHQTTIGFNLPVESEATLTVFDVTGKQVYQTNQPFSAGHNEVVISAEDLTVSGVLYYELTTAFGQVTRKMILQK